MIGSSISLHDVNKYNGKQHIQITNGSTLPITTIGNLRSFFTNIFVSSDLFVNFISVG
jgi:hypothetical protein